jgi:hypothetical protein
MSPRQGGFSGNMAMAKWQWHGMAIRSKVALAISAGGNFGRAPDNRRPRGYDLRGPQRLPLQGRARHQRRREFRSAPDNRRPRGYLGGVRWGCPCRSPKTLAVSGGVSLRCQGRSFGVACIFCARAREGFPIAPPHLVPQSSPASWLANRPYHSVPPVPLANVAIN